MVDGNTGAVLHASNADALRHPASLTKIMTLYLLFERLEAGKIKLDTPLKISSHAAEQSPTKLGVKPGQTLAVEDAIKAVVTKSANDAAVAIAENLGGDEDEFAKMMTAKAHALGMSRTTYVNASGLPNDDQITTAQDQSVLGRAIQERFPRYYKYFSTEQFVYHGHAMRNHNHLLGVVGGVDGIKTGYTHASGFNLVTSVHRDGRYIVAVVLGGRSAGERDAHMRELINSHIREASLRHTAPAIAERMEARAEPRTPSSERSEQREPKPVAAAKASLSSRADPTPTGKTNGGTRRRRRSHSAAVGEDDHLPHRSGPGCTACADAAACRGRSIAAVSIDAASDASGRARAPAPRDVRGSTGACTDHDSGGTSTRGGSYGDNHRCSAGTSARRGSSEHGGRGLKRARRHCAFDENADARKVGDCKVRQRKIRSSASRGCPT